MIQSVGIDFGKTGPHKVRCLEERAQQCDGFIFHSTPEGLAKLEERIFRDGSNPVIVFEPTGLAWLPVAIYLRARYPYCRLVRTKTQKVAALRKYLRGSSKSDRIDALTLAKMPFIDPEQLYEVYLRPAELHTLYRLNRQRWRLEQGVTARKNRIGAIIDGYFPSLRQAFDDRWSPHARAFYRSRLNPLAVVRAGEEALHTFLTEVAPRNKGSLVETHQVYMACQSAAAIYEASMTAGAVNEDSFADLQEEVACELRLMEAEEGEAESLARHIKELYRKLHPEDHLQTIPGVGEHTAPVFLAGVGEPGRFRNQSAFVNWNGVVPGAKQSSGVEGKGLRMTKGGPAIMKWGLYQAGDVGRQWDPQLAYVYYRQMVYHGKTHNQAMGAVMSHLAARILAVRREGRHYELRDTEGKPISKKEARQLILTKYQVSEDIRRQRRRRNPTNRNSAAKVRKKEEMVEHHKIHEAATAPQLEAAPPTPRNPVYAAELRISSKAAGLVATVVKPRERSPDQAGRSERDINSRYHTGKGASPET